jgi:Asp-tRNA(Asn)/Glu-tRNA(Gln) amidotransferase B subunit
MTLPIWIVSPKQNAEIVKMISNGTISRKVAKDLLDMIIEDNLKLIKEKK